MKKLVWMSGLLGAVLVSGCTFKHELLVNPKVDIPANASSTKVQQSVREALTSYGWTIDKEEPGETTAHLKRDVLFASVGVDYNQKQATIRYLDSKNFNYEKSSTGEERIHSHYLLWVRNIAERLREKLNPVPH